MDGVIRVIGRDLVRVLEVDPSVPVVVDPVERVEERNRWKVRLAGREPENRRETSGKGVVGDIRAGRAPAWRRIVEGDLFMLVSPVIALQLMQTDGAVSNVSSEKKTCRVPLQRGAFADVLGDYISGVG
jgi:hypothetical protein